MKALIDKVKSFFTKDTASEGESAKLLIVLRILFASLIVYCFIALVFCLCTGYCDGALCFGGAFALYLLMFVCSYHTRTMPLVIVSNILSAIAIIAGYFLLGPLVSIQSFFIVVVVMCYFSGYGYYKIKSIYTFLIFLVYFILQTCFGKIASIIPFTYGGQRFLQFHNLFASFWCVAIICYVYSRDSQHLEGKLIEYNKILKQQASTDTLTGLHNRRSANDFIEKLIKRNDEKGFCVCMCDIDFFKKVNDSYGHDIGDMVLAGVAQTLVENVTEECLVSRWGGEEFLIVFPNMNGDEAKSMLDTIRSRMKKIEFDTGSRKFSITITYGLAEYGFDGNAESVVKEADDKLYIGKENGRDQIVF